MSSRRVALLCVAALCAVVSACSAAGDADAGATAAAGAAPRLTLQHSLDGGATWVDRGVVTVPALEFQPAAADAKWTKDELARLREMALKKGEASVVATSLLVRIVDAAAAGKVLASLAVSPCALVVSAQYRTPLTYIAERYAVTFDAAAAGGAINSLRLINPFHDDVCEPSVFKTAAADVKLKISFTRSQGLTGLTLPFASSGADDANVHDGARSRRASQGSASAGGAGGGAGGAGKAPVDNGENKSFWEKYGTYIMIFLGVQALSGFLSPKGKVEGEEGKAKKE